MSTPRAIGTDLVDVARIRRLCERHPDRFRERCFTPREQRDAERSGLRRAAERYAARFAAKEAVLKSLGTGWSSGVAWTDVEVTLTNRGAPRIELSGGAHALAQQLGISAWLCSLTHTSEIAGATVLAVGPASSISGA
ncbi:MAG: holo-ACP synthase [Planctomycetota bacterium]